ncbi:methyltransferase domain-containing protein [Allosaccharopolyspora coralli]|uniref:Methyltransferase domain-containing protein n=1 Tax=Allosaccharopolyspora coralli TaxID=2665642 RepID=A0A5Q3Q7T3_9PSEU|nr:class I SAM-dependent methyltransferase [Allosaccharopolyspora coralli]QGK70423.1 methyltransferase domain-containing protein [Allosaccharopolyspora coralli]
MGANLSLLDTFGLGDEDLQAWLASGRPDEEFDSWLIDRVARCPSGGQAIAVYGAETTHDFARRAILGALDLGAGDRLLDVGCGGGQLLRDALDAGAQATGIDHSSDMVALARDRANGAEVVGGQADRLPFEDGAFTAAALSVVFFFFDDPVGVLRECARVLAADGRLAVYTTGPSLRGTAAAPEPVAGHGHFYDDEQLVSLAREAGLTDVFVTDDEGAQLLTARAPT